MGDRQSPTGVFRFRAYGFRAYGVAVAIALGLTVAIGLWAKLGYRGWAQAWVNDFSVDILYEMAWILAIGLVWPRLRSRHIAIGVFVATAAIEFSQLIPFPQALVSNLIWRLIMGTTFVWWDFPHYAVGCVLGWFILQQLRHHYLPSKSNREHSLSER